MSGGRCAQILLKQQNRTKHTLTLQAFTSVQVLQCYQRIMQKYPV